MASRVTRSGLFVEVDFKGWAAGDVRVKSNVVYPIDWWSSGEGSFSFTRLPEQG